MIDFFYILIEIFTWGLILFSILSFFPNQGARDLYLKLEKVYRPILEPISMLLNPIQKNLGLDFSPLVLILILNMIQNNIANMR
ncbi:MAG: YggT family protein [Candidatus Sericytochromatia bacterium]